MPQELQLFCSVMTEGWDRKYELDFCKRYDWVMAKETGCETGDEGVSYNPSLVLMARLN